MTVVAFFGVGLQAAWCFVEDAGLAGACAHELHHECSDGEPAGSHPGEPSEQGSCPSKDCPVHHGGVAVLSQALLVMGAPTVSERAIHADLELPDSVPSEVDYPPQL